MTFRKAFIVGDRKYMSLKIDHVSKIYHNTKKSVLRDASLEVEHGEFVCLVGPSGCGKSTLLNLIAGLELPTEGTITLNGKEITGPGSDRVVMFQEPALFPWLNVLDNVKFGMKAAGIEEEEQNKRAEKYLRMVHLFHYANYKISELSGGMRQRAALARALSMDSKVLLMDEPFSALDKQTKNMLRDEIEHIWMETKKTVVFVTHSVEEAVFFGTRVVLMGVNPGGIRKIVPIELERPRQIDSKEFVELRADLLKLLRKEVEKVAREAEGIKSL